MQSAKQFIATIPKLSVLLIFLPVAIFMHLWPAEGVWLFIVSGLGILGTVTLIGKATEEIANYAGPLWGGLLNATFGNVTEVIIALFALKKGLHDLVRSSITGSIIGNLLLVLGGAMLYGGLKYRVQRFSRTGAQINVGMLWIALIALLVPSLMHLALQLDPKLNADQVPDLIKKVSMAAAVILFILYVLSLVFSLRTHRYLLMPGDQEHHEGEWTKPVAIGMLLGATVIVAYLSELFVGSIDVMVEHKTIAMSQLFIGVIVVAVVGNASEGLVAVWVAREDRMELSFQIAMGSCLQVALLVTPVLVFASYLMGDFMTLEFNPFELMALGAAILVSSAALNDGESNWLEGAMFLAVYIFFAIVFWFHP